MHIFLNNKLVQKQEAMISPYDHGFLYGLGVFETLRLYDGHPFLLDDHLERLENGLKELNIKWRYSKKDVLSWFKDLSHKNNLQNAYIRLNISAGVDDLGLSTDMYEEPTIIVYMKELPKNPLLEKEGVILKTRRNTPEGNYRLKSHHYLNNVLAKRELSSVKQEGIFLTEDGDIAEGIVSNLFFVKNGAVYTPSLKTGILGGVTRQFVMALLTSLSIPVHEGFFSLEKLLESDEIFMTNSIQEIFSISNIGDRRYHYGDSSLASVLRNHYKQMTQKNWSYKDIGRK
ncbi:aminodeoxychorismate lyase [Priestia filamentosa]|uniref:aminodeoxychorismate lyase n=1 Tax=Priestia filamentosa TaxID=1402861 RepID=UPI002E235621|nr:aminodeoxychorismate lyase [Priestia filamentosa]MED3728191.1 aminodeoxychorismate lyase [Priestia filamentosa]